MRRLIFVISCMSLFAAAAHAEDISGSMSVNGQEATLTHAAAMEVDSDTEPGYLDVLVVLSSRELTADQMTDVEELERLSFKDNLSAIRLLLNPDCEVKSVSYYHPAFKVFLVNAGEDTWEPSAFDERVAGRIHSGGRQEGFNQIWEYDFTFSTPIVLDPEASDVAQP